MAETTRVEGHDSPEAARAGQASEAAARGKVARRLGRQSYPSLWSNRAFVTVLLGQGVSALGDAVSVTALPLLVVLLTGSGTQMGLVGVLQTAPHLVLGLPAGALADRWDRRRLMLLCDVGRAVLTGLIPLSMLLGLPTMPVVFAVTAPISALAVLFMAAYTASVPSLVGREQIGPANSYVQAFASLGFILGPGLAGVLAAWIGPGPTLALDALSFAVSALALGYVRRPLQSGEPRGESTIRRDIMEGLAFAWRERTLRMGIAFWSFVCISMAPIVPALTFYVTQDLRLSSSSLGLVISGYGVGALLGSFIAARVTKGRLGLLMLGGSVATGSLVALHSILSSVPAMAAASLGIGMSDAVVLVSYLTLRATLTPDNLLGRVSSSARVISFGLAPVGMLAGGLLLDLVGGAATLLTMGALVVLSALLFSLSPVLRAARSGE